MTEQAPYEYTIDLCLGDLSIQVCSDDVAFISSEMARWLDVFTDDTLVPVKLAPGELPIPKTFQVLPPEKDPEPSPPEPLSAVSPPAAPESVQTQIADLMAQAVALQQQAQALMHQTTAQEPVKEKTYENPPEPPIAYEAPSEAPLREELMAADLFSEPAQTGHQEVFEGFSRSIEITVKEEVSFEQPVENLESPPPDHVQTASYDMVETDTFVASEDFLQVEEPPVENPTVNLETMPVMESMPDEPATQGDFDALMSSLMSDLEQKGHYDAPQGFDMSAVGQPPSKTTVAETFSEMQEPEPEQEEEPSDLSIAPNIAHTLDAHFDKKMSDLFPEDAPPQSQPTLPFESFDAQPTDSNGDLSFEAAFAEIVVESQAAQAQEEKMAPVSGWSNVPDAPPQGGGISDLPAFGGDAFPQEEADFPEEEPPMSGGIPGLPSFGGDAFPESPSPKSSGGIPGLPSFGGDDFPPEEIEGNLPPQIDFDFGVAPPPLSNDPRVRQLSLATIQEDERPFDVREESPFPDPDDADLEGAPKVAANEWSSSSSPATETQQDIESLLELCEFAPSASSSSDFLLLAAYFLTTYKQMEKFALKDLNAQLVRSGLTPVNHGILETVIAEKFMELLPDLTGTAATAEYILTQSGRGYTESLLEF